jgi:hypothetical protein
MLCSQHGEEGPGPLKIAPPIYYREAQESRSQKVVARGEAIIKRSSCSEPQSFFFLLPPTVCLAKVSDKHPHLSLSQMQCPRNP